MMNGSFIPPDYSEMTISEGEKTPLVPVITGTDVFGAVERVEATAIVTKFETLWFFPVQPKVSFYYLGLNSSAAFGTHGSKKIVGLPLARLSRRSVATAYVRALAGMLLLFGIIPLIIGGVNALMNQRFSSTSQLIITISATAVTAGLTVGAISYLQGSRVAERDFEIRRQCDRVLGISADPAHIVFDFAANLGRRANEVLHDAGFSDFEKISGRLRDMSVELLCVALVTTRARLATEPTSAHANNLTDQILQELRARGAVV